MIRGTILPLALIALLGFAACFAVSAARSIAFRSAAGRPIDWAGDGIRCQCCETGVMNWQRGHRYYCSTCGSETTASYSGGLFYFGDCVRTSEGK